MTFFRFSPSPFLMFLNPAFFVAGAASAAHFPALTLPEVFLSSLSPPARSLIYLGHRYRYFTF